LVQPGAWTETRVPFADLMMSAWRKLNRGSKRLLWLGGRDFDALSAQFAGEPDLLLLRDDWQIDRLMAASDVLITKANRLTVYEAAALGLPSISVSTSANWPDDMAVARVDSNEALKLDLLTAETFAAAIERAAATNPVPATAVSGGVARAAERIARYVASS